MIRVLHFVHRIPPEYSGAAFQALRLIEALRGLETGEPVESHLVAYAADARLAAPPAGLPTTVVGLRQGLFGKLRQYGELRRAFTRVRPDVVHVHGYHRPAVLFGRFARRPTVLKTTLLDVDDVRSIRGKGALDALLVRGVERVVSMTPALAAANAGARTAIIPNGVDLALFRPRPLVADAARAARRSIGIGEDDLLLLFVGGDCERKGFRRLPELWREVARQLGPRARLFVAGRFERPDSAAWLRGEIGDALVLEPGLVDLPVWLHAADVFLFLSEREGLPNAVLEAAATDTFVFARDLPGTFEGILHEGNSVVAPELDAGAVARLAARLAGGDHRRVDNCDFREHFGLERVAERYRSLYRELMEHTAA